MGDIARQQADITKTRLYVAQRLKMEGAGKEKMHEGRSASLKNRKENPFLLDTCLSPPRRQFFETVKRMKIEENEGQFFFKKLFHIPPVPSFHSNRFHNTVTSKGACGSVYAFLTRLRPHKRKPRGDTEIKKGSWEEEGLQGR